jgi:hypothetical protein
MVNSGKSRRNMRKLDFPSSCLPACTKARRLARLKFPFSIPETVDFYRVHYGPTLKAFAGLSETAQAALRRDLEDLYAQHNDARDGTTCIAAEYLEVVGTRT